MFRILLCLAGLLFLPLSAQAVETVSIEVSPGIRADASYWAGEEDLPAVLILHGFLQTRDFPTVQRLAESLAESGYPVLTPTLSLGIDHRNQSLSCEAIHTHSMQQDIHELGQWVDWLRNKSGQYPVLIGHSAGSVQSLAYLSAQDHAPVQKAILISLTYFGEAPGAYETKQQYQQALEATQRGDQELAEYSLAYCRKYVTTAEGFLSYYRYSGDYLKGAVRQLTVPTDIIYGTRDDRIDEAWLQELNRFGFRVHKVSGANHFFDQQHEFELLERIEDLLGD